MSADVPVEFLKAAGFLLALGFLAFVWIIPFELQVYRPDLDNPEGFPNGASLDEKKVA